MVVICLLISKFGNKINCLQTIPYPRKGRVYMCVCVCVCVCVSMVEVMGIIAHNGKNLPMIDNSPNHPRTPVEGY